MAAFRIALDAAVGIVLAICISVPYVWAQPATGSAAPVASAAGGALLTRFIAPTILMAAAASLGVHDGGAGLTSIGAISGALTPVLGPAAGRLVFSLGVLGAQWWRRDFVARVRLRPQRGCRLAQRAGA